MARLRLKPLLTLVAGLLLAFASSSLPDPTYSADEVTAERPDRRMHRRASVPARPLRVAHVNANFTAGSGGITLREAAAVDPDRYRATIFAPGDGTLFERAERAGLEVVRLRRMNGGRRVRLHSQPEAARELSERLREGRFDVVHTHAGMAGAIGRIAARRAGVPALVHTFHGFPFNEFQSAATRRALLEIERRLGRITDWFLTDGTFIASEAIRLKIAPPDRVRALISPIDHIPPATETARRHARSLLGLPAAARVIGTTARLATQKAPLDMVKAIAALPQRDVYTAWVGDGPLRAKTERLIKQQGLSHRFLLIGDRDDVPRLLPAFDIFAMSSLWEGLPCSVIEAMTCGIPVVANAVNSVPEVVISGNTGLVAKPGDPHSLARALAYMLDHPTEAARMAKTAQHHIGDQYHPHHLGQQLAHVYDNARAVQPL
jgi:glycosyltransferase involved in cell wall biosynthesis